jgi:hypothetical protein
MRYWSLSGYPALAVPMGFSPAGLPLSLQIVGAPFAEATVLGVGAAFQTVTAWHRAEPVLSFSHPPDGAAGTGPFVPGPPAAAAEALARHGVDAGDDIAALAAAYTVHLGDVETLRQGVLFRQR